MAKLMTRTHAKHKVRATITGLLCCTDNGRTCPRPIRLPDTRHRPSRITPQFSGRTPPCEARSKRIMKWRACCAPAPTYHGPLELLVRRQTRCSTLDQMRLQTEK